MQKDNWLPSGYEVPKTDGNYMKFEQGANKFRVMSQPIMGWVYWTREKKPVRVRQQPKEIPANIRAGDKIKHFWAFAVWNYTANKIQILEITQASIQGPLTELVTNSDWGPPQDYDVTITRKGEGLDSEYTVTPSPHKDVPQEARSALRDARLNLEALFDGGEPFGGSTVEITKDDIPFN